MTKFATLPTNTAPALSDTVVSVKSGPTDVQITLQAIKNLIVPQRLRRIMFGSGIDAAGGGTTIVSEFGNGVKFGGGVAPGAFFRGGLIVPSDYVAGTNAALKIWVYSVAGGPGTLGVTHYIGSHVTGDNLSTEWNVVSNVNTATQVMVINIFYEFTLSAIPAANLAIGAKIGIAAKLSGTPAADTFFSHAVMEYTADV